MAQKPDTAHGKGKGQPSAKPLAKGFVQAGGLLGTKLRTSAEKRGFVETRLLTRWVEIVGADTAAMTKPVSVSYAAGGMGATLILLADGAFAPQLQMQLPTIKDRVNACYGYNAISRIKLTQTAATGFGEEPAVFVPKDAAPIRDVEINSALSQIGDSDLRTALDQLGRNVLARPKTLTNGKTFE
jgi:hypothetical protein